MSIIFLSILLAFANFMNFVTCRLAPLPQNIFLLAGESNIAGQGGVVKGAWDGVVPPESAPDPNVLKLNAGLNWEEAKEPLHAGIDIHATNGIGPGIPFAKTLLLKNPRLGVIGLVPSAHSGSQIIAWQKGKKLYNQLVTRAKASRNIGGVIQALLWYQGESDTVVKADADAYKEIFKRFISDLRADLKLPNLLVLQVALASGEGNFTEAVRKVQLNNGVPNTRVVDAKGLPLQDDKVHLSTSSQVRLGEKLADAFR